jgi:hypothetical protein
MRSSTDPDAEPVADRHRGGRVTWSWSTRSAAVAGSLPSGSGHGSAAWAAVTAVAAAPGKLPRSAHRRRGAPTRAWVLVAGARPARRASPPDHRWNTTAGPVGRRRCGRRAARGPPPRRSGNRVAGRGRRPRSGHGGDRTGQHRVTCPLKADQTADRLTEIEISSADACAHHRRRVRS